MQSEIDPTGFKLGTAEEDIEAGQRLIDEQAEADRLKRQQEIQQEQPTAQPQQQEPSTEGNNFVEELGSAIGKGVLGATQSVATAPERYYDMVTSGDSDDKDEVDADWEKLYTSALQKKFLWVKSINEDWKQVSNNY